jgi:hypothetical protein
MSQLRLLHIALSLSAVVMTLIFGALRSLGPAATDAVPPTITNVLLGFAALIILSAATLRTRIAAANAGDSEEVWAGANKGSAIILWAMLEGSAAICGIALFLGGNPVLAGGFAAGALGFLVSQSPGTLAGH